MNAMVAIKLIWTVVHDGNRGQIHSSRYHSQANNEAGEKALAWSSSRIWELPCEQPSVRNIVQPNINEA
jgi:hypothetical protein